MTPELWREVTADPVLLAALRLAVRVLKFMPDEDLDIPAPQAIIDIGQWVGAVDHSGNLTDVGQGIVGLDDHINYGSEDPPP